MKYDDKDFVPSQPLSCCVGKDVSDLKVPFKEKPGA